MLDHRHGNAHDVGFLERIGAHERAWNLACDHNKRYRVHVGSCDSRDRIGGSRTACDQGDANIACCTRIAVGLVHRTLLVTGQHVANHRGIKQRVVDFYGLASGITEYQVDPFGFERCDDRLGACHGLALFRVLAAQAAWCACASSSADLFFLRFCHSVLLVRSYAKPSTPGFAFPALIARKEPYPFPCNKKSQHSKLYQDRIAHTP